MVIKNCNHDNRKKTELLGRAVILHKKRINRDNCKFMAKEPKYKKHVMIFPNIAHFSLNWANNCTKQQKYTKHDLPKYFVEKYVRIYSTTARFV